MAHDLKNVPHQISDVLLYIYDDVIKEIFLPNSELVYHFTISFQKITYSLPMSLVLVGEKTVNIENN